MKTIPSLEALGLTQLEALAYTYLVSCPGITGYKVSKGIGKPTANVYRALESLERKGAVRHDRGAPPLFSAVPPAELLDQLERDFLDRREIAARALASIQIGPDTDEDGIHALKSPDQVIGRARIMLAAARRVVLIEASEHFLAALADVVADARARGVRTVVLARAAPGAAHVDTIVDSAPPVAGAILRVVADAHEGLMASLAPRADAVKDAVWTRSALFARTLHDAIANDVFFVLVGQGLRDGLSVEELEGAFESCRAVRALARD
jgi:sugar-specific transcriptional regulator TrmB